MDSPIVEDLVTEQTVPDSLVCALDEEMWATPSPAVGWNVRDQIAHLAFFDDVAVTSVIGDGEEFARVGVRRMRLGDAGTLRAHGPLAEVAPLNLKAYL